MREDVYRTQARPAEQKERDGASIEDFVLPALFFVVGLLLIGTAIIGGRGHAGEAGLGAASLIFAGWIFVQAIRASRRQR